MKIFKGKIEKYEDENITVYGYGFTNFTDGGVDLEEVNLDKNKINILVIHGSLDASNSLDVQYNPIKSYILKSKGFNYVALGHIHKNNFSKYENIIYPGSTISLGFDELGEHGMVVGDISVNNVNLEFQKLDEREFIEKEIDITDIFSKEDLIQKINEENLNEKNMYKIILVGRRNYEINLNDIQKNIFLENILKIKDKTILNYNLEEISKENSLRGLFVKIMLDKLQNELVDEEEIKKAIEIGLLSL